MITALLDTNTIISVLFGKKTEDNIIREAIKNKKLTSYLSETMFTIEALKRGGDRTKYFSESQVRTSSNEDNYPNIQMTISHHPGKEMKLDSYKLNLLNEAHNIGILLLQFPRIAGPSNSDIDKKHYAPFNPQANEKAGLLSSIIEKKGYGFAPIENIIRQDSRLSWGALDEYNPRDVDNFFAEWADGDSIATCYGHELDYFCTNDEGKSAKGNSILSQTNRRWLKKEFGVNIVSPHQLTSKFKS